ncbi:MAG: phosphoribosyltransferase [Verrucomicrobia bacterium]|nr:phosphoribosyltransferase [Verrucomicrobiota bacterium]
MVFRDRVHAGQLLAGALMKYASRDDVIVLGLPRGGVPVAFEVARKLHAPLDVIVVRKLGVPGWEELAMGAIASGGVRVINHEVVRAADISPDAIEAAAAEQLKELHRRELAYRGHTSAPEIEGKTAIIVDDGIATGSTIRAAVQALRQQEPKQIIIAVPVASVDSAAMLQPMVDEFVTLVVPVEFRAVGQWYQNFSQTTDAEVADLLAQGCLQERILAPDRP